MSVRTDIIGLLRSGGCQGITFSIDRTRINAADYRQIARFVESNQIQVVQTARATNFAGYNRRYNCFLVGASPRPATVVHEATHAINDRYRRSLVDVEDEVLAYVSQCLYVLATNPTIAAGAQAPRFRQNTRDLMRVCVADADYCNSAAIGQAMLIAVDLRAGGPVNAAALAALRQALQLDPTTHQDPTNTRRTYDGVRRTTVPPEYLQEVQGTLVTN